MKKKLLALLGVIIISSALNSAFAKPNSEVAEAIKLYKAQNYTQCYAVLTEYVEKDPSNALAYYYLAVSATQMGKREEAIDNYTKTLNLVSPTSKIGGYAARGKLCLEDEEACQESQYSSIMEEVLGTKSDDALSPKVKEEYERLKIENLMREMNRGTDIPAQKFKEYKDFSSLNTNSMPSNDEIVAALRTLQRAGLSNVGQGYSELSLLTGNQNNDLMNIMGSNINPQIMQALFTNNMTLGY